MDFRKYGTTAVLILFAALFAVFAAKHADKLETALADGAHLSNWSKWLKTPFMTKMDLADWFVITCLAATISFFWVKILENHMSVEILENL